MAEHKLIVHARASLGEEMQPLDPVAVAILAVKAVPGAWWAPTVSVPES